MEPRRAIFSEFQLRRFQRSTAHQALVELVTEGAKAVRFQPATATDGRLKPVGKSSSQIRGVHATASGSYCVSPVVQRLSTVFAEFDAWIDEIPPLQQPMRFGNRAFCDWHRRLTVEGTQKVSEALVEGLREAGSGEDAERHRLQADGGEGLVEEASAYLFQCFGHPVRIDYGTGHETSFVMWWLSLRRAGALSENDTAAMVLEVFAKGYLNVVRRLQLVYMLEPAGSHGVWGLDDFHCLPFLWGAAQLCATDTEDDSTQSVGDWRPPELAVPGCVREAGVLENDELAANWVYIAAIKHVLTIKTGAPFSEVAPMLFDISGLPNWERVLRGLVRLYLGEVLGKFPVVQHFVFGSLIPADWADEDQQTVGAMRSEQQRGDQQGSPIGNSTGINPE